MKYLILLGLLAGCTSEFDEEVLRDCKKTLIMSDKACTCTVNRFREMGIDSEDAIKDREEEVVDVMVRCALWGGYE